MPNSVTGGSEANGVELDIAILPRTWQPPVRQYQRDSVAMVRSLLALPLRCTAAIPVIERVWADEVPEDLSHETL